MQARKTSYDTGFGKP